MKSIPNMTAGVVATVFLVAALMSCQNDRSLDGEAEGKEEWTQIAPIKLNGPHNDPTQEKPRTNVQEGTPMQSANLVQPKPTMDGQYRTPEPANENQTVQVSQDGDEIDLNVEYQRRCKAWAMDNLMPHVYAEFRLLDPATMDDLDRSLWQKRLRGGTLPTYQYDSYSMPIGGSGPTRFCHIYWSEKLDTSNADLRNGQFKNKCHQSLTHAIDYEWDKLVEAAVRHGHDDTAAYDTPNQYVRVMRWLNIGGDELLRMEEPPYEILKRFHDKKYAYETNILDQRGVKAREDQYGPEFDIQWWGIVRATVATRGETVTPCTYYYPQLFYGYWVPFPEPTNGLSKGQSESIDQLKDNEPLYLPRPR